MSEKNWVVYLIRCSDNSLYCGISNDLKSRLTEHNSGKGAKYTRLRRPVKLVGISPELTKSKALELEHRIKKLPVDKKVSELAKEANAMAIYKKDLKSLQKEIKALEKKMDKLIAAAKKSEKTQPVKAKITKRAQVKKKATKLTATEQVLKIINRSKKGVDTATLMKKTGFDRKKVTNILQQTFKQGKIKRVAKGIYVGA